MKKDRRRKNQADQKRQDDEGSRLISHMEHTLNYHERLLSDRVRNQTFYKALKRHVRPGSSVMDIGSGTGVWAIAAAILGASRVVAIERDKILIPIIEKLASKNGVKDRIEVIEGDSREAKVEGKFDVIISETVGNHAFDEGIVPIIIDAKKRFLKENGVVIPEAIASVVAPAHIDSGVERLPAGLKLDYRYLEVLNRDITKKITDQTSVKLLGPPAVLTNVNLKTVTEMPTLTDMKCKWRLKDAGSMNSLILWAHVVLTKGVSLQTIRHTKGWNPVALPVDPFPKGPAVIECTISQSNKQYYWTVSRNHKGEREVQSHSPMFPYTSIQAHRKSG